jgi:hypothetical protein
MLLLSNEAFASTSLRGTTMNINAMFVDDLQCDQISRKSLERTCTVECKQKDATTTV